MYEKILEDIKDMKSTKGIIKLSKKVSRFKNAPVKWAFERKAISIIAEIRDPEDLAFLEENIPYLGLLKYYPNSMTYEFPDLREAIVLQLSSVSTSYDQALAIARKYHCFDQDRIMLAHFEQRNTSILLVQ